MDKTTKEKAVIIINEVMNNDPEALLLAIEKFPDCIDERSFSGDAALHVAAYKLDARLVHILMYSHSNPNLKNSTGDTAFHISARLGDLASLIIMYDTLKCDLLLQNNDSFTALEVTKLPVDTEDVKLLHLYGPWTSEFDNQAAKEAIRLGRKKCAEFLESKLMVDYTKRRLLSVSLMRDSNIEFSRSANIIRGKGDFSDRMFKSDLNYACRVSHYQPHELDFNKLEDDREGTEEAVTGIFVADMVERLLRSGIVGTSLAAQVGKLNALTATRTDLLESFENEDERVQES